MGQRRCLNERRLTKKQVLELITTEGKLHEAYTAVFSEVSPNGRVKRDKGYALSGERFLFVFDEQDGALPGRGDIYAKEYFLRWMQWVQRVREEYAHNRASSVDHWRFYSRYKDQLITHLPALQVELAQVLDLDGHLLDGSYASLEVLSAACERYGLENVFVTLYDNVVAYVGEVLKKRVKGYWEVNTNWSGGLYPFISIGQDKVQYMVLNVVWQALSGLNPVDFRKEAANEVRRQAFLK